jgi:hypothetical protein
MATQFNQCLPEDIYKVVHQALEETPVYQGKNSIQTTLAGLYAFDCYAIGSPPVGAVIFRGNEGHIAVLKGHRKIWATKDFYRFMRRQVEQRGVIKVKCGNPDAMPFIQRLIDRGFVCLENS